MASLEPVDVGLGALVALVLLLLSWHDIRSRRIPNAIAYPALIAAVGTSWTLAGHGLRASLLGGVAALLTTCAIRMLSRGGLGGGDVKMATFVGIAVGYPAVTTAGAVAVLAAGGTAGALLLVGLIDRRASLPVGPFIALGGLFAVVF